MFDLSRPHAESCRPEPARPEAVWRASPASLERIGLGQPARIVAAADAATPAASRTFIRSAWNAAAPEQRSDEHRGGAVAVLLAVEQLPSLGPENVHSRIHDLLEQLHLRQLAQRTVTLPDGDPLRGLQECGPGWVAGSSEAFLELLDGDRFASFALILCRPSAHLALVRYVEREVCFHAELYARRKPANLER